MLIENALIFNAYPRLITSSCFNDKTDNETRHSRCRPNMFASTTSRGGGMRRNGATRGVLRALDTTSLTKDRFA